LDFFDLPNKEYSLIGTIYLEMAITMALEEIPPL